MSNEIAVDDFLAHYGVKGMKWGVVKAKASGAVDAVRNTPSNLKNRYDNLTPEQQRNVKIAAGTALAVGAAAGAALLIAHGNTKTSAALARESVKLGSAVVSGMANKESDEIFKGVNLSQFNRDVDAMTMTEVEAKAATYWTSTEGRSVAKNINLDISMYDSPAPKTDARNDWKKSAQENGQLNAVRDRLNDPSYVWKL